MKLNRCLIVTIGSLLASAGFSPPAALATTNSLPRPARQITVVAPMKFEKRGEVYFADFGSAVFGKLQISPPNTGGSNLTLAVRVGEKLTATGVIDRKPPGCVSFREFTAPVRAGEKLEFPPLKNPLRRDFITQFPPEIGDVTPFRYAEIEAGGLTLTADSFRQLFVHTAFDDNASAFTSSDETLDAVWNLCKHTMKATTAFGVYIDGERERKPYEADAYINFLSHLACDANPEVGRYTIEYLLANPTWPTEWSFHMPMLAEAEYMATGDATLIARNYEALKTKLLMDKAGADGLIRAKAICDWPAGERDKFDAKLEVNAPVNAFFFHALNQMTVLAKVLRKTDDAELFAKTSKQLFDVFNEKFFNPATGLYLDGEGSNHTSLHANMFALNFGLVPAERQAKVVEFIRSRGMACSVYGAQYLLEALYQSGQAGDALKLMASQEQRSWWNMIRSGSTMTTEAWDHKFKNNLTWNHAWGAAPANIISRFLVGVRPLTAGYEKILIAPQPGTLKWFKAQVPTVRGPVVVDYRQAAGGHLEIVLPAGTSADVSLPTKTSAVSLQVSMDHKPIAATAGPNVATIKNISAGRHVFDWQ